jgi:hypothetical protein
MSDRETAPYRRIAELERENAALREQIVDWENAVLHARDNRSDEQHCTCVAPLVGRVKQLERDNAALRERLHIADAEIDMWASRCSAAIWLMPEPVTGGQLREAQDKFHRMLHAARKEKP